MATDQEKAWFSSKVVAAAFSTTKRSLENWASKGLIESDAQLGYEVMSVARHVVGTLRKKADQARDKVKSPDGVKAQQERKLTFEADILEIKRDQMRGDLISREDVLTGWNDLLGRCWAKILAIPARVSLEVSEMSDPLDIEELLQGIIDEALNELSESTGPSH